MTNVSTHNTSSKDYHLAYQQLMLVISKLNESQSSIFFNGLFTDAEKIMLVKIFAAIVFFDQSYTSYKVAATVGLSLSTTQRLYEQYENGNFNKMLKCVPIQQRSELLEILQSFLLSKASYKARRQLTRKLQTS